MGISPLYNFPQIIISNCYKFSVDFSVVLVNMSGLSQFLVNLCLEVTSFITRFQFSPRYILLYTVFNSLFFRCNCSDGTQHTLKQFMFFLWSSKYSSVHVSFLIQRLLKYWVKVFPETQIKRFGKLILISVEVKSN